MDDLRLRKYFDQGAGYERVCIEINGIQLIDRLKEFEQQLDPKLAGEYMDIAAVELDLQALSGSGAAEWADILTCTCGELGCWSFQIQARAFDDVVEWHAFQQPHRADVWDYSRFGPFRFDRASYTQELDQLA